MPGGAETARRSQTGLVFMVQQFQLWSFDSVYKKMKLAKPKLASWNANDDPEQIAVQRYLPLSLQDSQRQRRYG